MCRNLKLFLNSYPFHIYSDFLFLLLIVVANLIIEKKYKNLGYMYLLNSFNIFDFSKHFFLESPRKTINKYSDMYNKIKKITKEIVKQIEIHYFDSNQSTTIQERKQYNE